MAKLSVRAVDRLFEASGGHALFDASPIQRFHRDAHAASHHFGLAWETVAEEYGRMRLGLEPRNPARSLAEKCTDLDCSDIIVRII